MTSNSVYQIRITNTYEYKSNTINKCIMINDLANKIDRDVTKMSIFQVVTTTVKNTFVVRMVGLNSEPWSWDRSHNIIMMMQFLPRL